MSCVVSVLVDGKLFMGSDSGVFLEDNIIPSYFEKVFWKGEFLVGVVGSVRSSQVIRYGMDLPSMEDRDPMEYMVNTFTASLRKSLNEMGRSMESDDGEVVTASILVGMKDNSHKHRLFLVGHDFSILEPNQNYFSIGAGSDAAMGYLDAVSNTAEDEGFLRVKEALEVAGKFSPWVIPPYKVTEFES
jgi:ATP-dependent protease HslVU (ClpYQ) peptidase subunit